MLRLQGLELLLGELQERPSQKRLPLPQPLPLLRESLLGLRALDPPRRRRPLAAAHDLIFYKMCLWVGSYRSIINRGR